MFLADDDTAVRDSLALLMKAAGLAVEIYASGEAFLAACPADRPSYLELAVVPIETLGSRERRTVQCIFL